MKKQDLVRAEYLKKGYRNLPSRRVSMNGRREYVTYVMQSPEGEKITINFRGTVNSKNSLTV